MKNTVRFIAAIALAFAITTPALPDAASDKLGEEYAKAAPAEKIALLSVARSDKTLGYPETSKAVDEIAEAEVGKGTTAKERLEIMGKLRTEAQEKVKAINEKRKAEKKQWVSCAEPDGSLQQAVALAYISDAAGPKPSLEALGVLKLVRDCTDWTSHHRLVLAALDEAVARDEGYAKADHAGKLDVIKNLVDKSLAGEHERSYLEHAVVFDWMNTGLKGGKSAGDLHLELKKMGDAKKLGFFTRSWAEGLLKKMPTPKK